MNNIDMKRAVRMNGWCFAGDERTVQTSVQKLIDKGFELQLTLNGEAVVGKLLVEMTKDSCGRFILALKVTTNPPEGFNLASARVDINGQSVIAQQK